MLPVRASTTCRVCVEATFFSPSQLHQWKGGKKIYSKKTCRSPGPAGKRGRSAEKGCAILQWRPESFAERSKTTRSEPRQDAGILHELVWVLSSLRLFEE